MSRINDRIESDFLGLAMDAVEAAEKIILHYLNQKIQIDLKGDLSPVTIADREAEASIRETILTAFPNHTFYGEEGEKTNLADHKGYTWIIDPIDGTKSYMRGSPLFATQLALLHDGDFVLGVSNAPLLNELLYAEKNKGCYLNHKPVKVSRTKSIDDAYISFGSLKYFIEHSNIQQLLSLSQRAKWARGIGDFWSYHLLAQGKLDVMIEADTKLWDIAAMKVIIEEAGGTVTDISGNPVSHTTSSLLATNGMFHDELVRLFKS